MKTYIDKSKIIRNYLLSLNKENLTEKEFVFLIHKGIMEFKMAGLSKYDFEVKEIKSILQEIGCPEYIMSEQDVTDQKENVQTSPSAINSNPPSSESYIYQLLLTTAQSTADLPLESTTPEFQQKLDEFTQVQSILSSSKDYDSWFYDKRLEMFDSLKSIKKDEMSEKDFYIAIIKELEKLQILGLGENYEMAQLRKVLEEIGCVDYDTWKQHSSKSPSTATDLASLGDGSVESAVCFVNLFLKGSPEDIRYGHEKIISPISCWLDANGITDRPIIELREEQENLYINPKEDSTKNENENDFHISENEVSELIVTRKFSSIINTTSQFKQFLSHSQNRDNSIDENNIDDNDQR